MDRPIDRRGASIRKRLLLLGAVAALATGVVLVVPAARRWLHAERVADASRLRIAEVTRGDLERDVMVQGRVVAALHPTLYSPAQGIVTLAAKPGLEVKKGDELARIQSPELTSRLSQERSTLLSLQSELSRHRIAGRRAAVHAKQIADVLAVKLEAADRALRRATSLRNQGLLSSFDSEKANDDAALALLEVNNARETAKLEKESLAFEERTRQLLVERQQSIVDDLERQVGELRVDAPFDGLIAAVSVQDRDAVARNQPLLSVVSLTAFELELALPERSAGDVVAGTVTEVQVQGKPRPGRITRVSPEVRDGQVRATMAFEGESPAGLRQSELLSTRIVLDRHPSVLKLPRGPFLESGGGRKAYVVKDGVAVQRAITMGAVSVSEAEVVSGLQEGERVVVSDTAVFEGAETVLIRE